MNIPNLLAHQSRKYPDKEGIVTPYERVTYKEWDDKVNQLASSLIEIGLEKGDKVVLHMPNTKEFLFCYFAVQRTGAIIVPINAKLVQQEISYILDHSDAKIFITHELLFDQVKDMPERAGVLFIKTGRQSGKWHSFEQLLMEGSTAEISCPLTDDDEAALLYTSGTTGDPKGVVFTYRNILTVATMMCIEMTMNTQSRILHMMPLSHSAPLHLFMVAGTYVGATHVVVPTFNPELFLETVERERTTHFFGAPVAYLAAAKHPKIREYDLRSMEYWVYGGAPLGKQEVEYIQQSFGTDRLMCVYGLTEAGPSGTLLGFEEHREKAGSVGKRAALNCELKLVDDKGIEVPVGTVGEIVLRGEGNMKRYYKDEEKTAEVLKGGWVHTGDMARQDEDGYYWVVDRKKDMIISGGVNIYPKEIEDELAMHPSISEVAVVGVPNPDWGETVKAFIVLNQDIENLDEECRDFLQGKVAEYKLPRIFEKVDSLPRNATGKLLKNHLRQTTQA
ncbi:class I adenylate-forming enzyme family protein [Sediminibacillus massiliensis]|uniref:class I adenylate-forming enzyme family protein n=1 Tax=Sediminibacillus massiliensis TaxID=1926277 RepID=UPI0009887134|nr:long-chain-fatty-acid--CoA ligase [Sediminibacillus massiliensis]